jgi:integrase
LGLGEWGKIGYSWTDDRVRAYANYRGEDGVTSKVERWGDNEDQARRTLVKHLKSLAGSSASLTTQSTFAAVADAWLKDIEADVKYTTLRRYRQCLKNQLVPRIGGLTMMECRKPANLQKAVDKIVQAHSASTAHLARSIMHSVFRFAIRSEENILDADPAEYLKDIKGSRKRIVAFDSDEVPEFFAAVDADRYMRRSYVPDLLRLIFGTGVRIGEALALEWQYLNLTDGKKKVTHPVFGDRTLPPHTVWINGNIVHGEGSVPIRHDGKTNSSEGVLYLPPSLVMMLQYRMPQDALPSDPVFPGSRHRYQAPQLAIRSIRNLCDRIGYPDVTSKWGRKTVGTYLTEQGQRGAVRNQLRHADDKTADEHYIARIANPAAAEALERLFRPDAK